MFDVHRLDFEPALTPLDAQVSAIEGTPVRPYSTNPKLAMELVKKHQINFYWRKADGMCVAYIYGMACPAPEDKDPNKAICKALVSAKRAEAVIR
jgi:hypothetical protein